MTTDCFPEILAPVGSRDHLEVALQEGVDSVYLGLHGYHARPDRFGFTLDEIESIIRVAHPSLRVYVAVNNPVPSRCGELLAILDRLDRLSVDAVIVSDWGLLSKLHDSGFAKPLHVSVLSGVDNSASLAVARSLGATRAVLSPSMTASQISVLAKTASGMELEILAAGGICLFDCYRCKLRHCEKQEGFWTECSENFSWSGCNTGVTAKRRIETVMISPSWYLKQGIRCFKIEGRTREKEDVRRLIRSLKGELPSGPTRAGTTSGTRDPYMVAERLQITCVPRSPDPSVKHNTGRDTVETISALSRVRLIDEQTQFWIFPLARLQGLDPGLNKIWDGLVINDLAGPPFSPILEDGLNLQWQSPLYTSESSLKAILERMNEFCSLPHAACLRLHDVGLLQIAAHLRQGEMNILWDRFGWPFRVRSTSPLFEAQLAKWGVDIYEYDLSQTPSQNFKELRKVLGLLLFRDNLCALVPPVVSSQLPQASQTPFRLGTRQYSLNQGLLFDAQGQRSGEGLRMKPREVVVAIDSVSELEGITNWLSTFKGSRPNALP